MYFTQEYDVISGYICYILPGYDTVELAVRAPPQQVGAPAGFEGLDDFVCPSGLHKLWYPVVRDRSTWSKFGAHGERGDVFGELCSGLASEGEKQAYIC